MGMPQPDQNHKRLEQLVGTWEGVETMYPSQWDPEGGEAQGLRVGKVILGGFAVTLDYEQSRDGTCTYSGHGVYTFDGRKNEIVLHWFDSMGMGVDVFRGTWDGDAFSLYSQSSMGHTRVHTDFSSVDRYSTSLAMSQDGENWKMMFEGSYAKKA